MITSPAMLGNAALLEGEKTAFLSSRKVPPKVVLWSYDWAAKMRDAGFTVIGGFESALERDILKYLLKGTQSIVMVLACALWKKVPSELAPHIEAGRLLVVSPVAQSVKRISAESATCRNRWILKHCTNAVFATISPGGNLDKLAREFPDLPYTVLGDVRGISES